MGYNFYKAYFAEVGKVFVVWRLGGTLMARRRHR